MAEIPRDDSKDEKNEKKEFIRETIVKPEKPRRRGRSLLWTLALALVFGVTSSLTFVIARPFWEGQLGEKEPPESVSLARDDTTEAPDQTEAEDPAGETGEETTESNLMQVDPEELERLVEEAVGQTTLGLDDLESLYTVMNSLVAEANRSLVVITAYTTDRDWFDNEYASGQQSCGLVVAVTGQEVLILTDSQIVEGQETVRVSFGSHGEADGTCKQRDRTTGIAVVTVPVSSLAEDCLSFIQPVTLGNSYLVSQGTPVIAIGSPQGTLRSVATGLVSVVNSNIQAEDSQIRLICTDMTGCSTSSGFLLNLDGEVVGWITTAYNSADQANVVRALSISELKGKIEKLLNGEATPSLGVQGQTVTAAISEERQIPMGVYITQCVADKPAYLSGLQNGDILTALDGTPVASVQDLQAKLEALPADAQVTVTVQRSGREGYEEMTFAVQLTAR